MNAMAPILSTAMPLRGGSRRRYSRGQSAVELALIIPLLLTSLLVAVELGRLFYISISISNAARAGVQYGAQSLTTANDNSGMELAAVADAPLIASMTTTAAHFCKCSDGSASTCLATDCSSSHRLLYVQVNTSAPYAPILNYPGVPTAMALSGVAVMRVAQ
jgi:Flp pilus assembly protein TadG